MYVKSVAEKREEEKMMHTCDGKNAQGWMRRKGDGEGKRIKRETGRSVVSALCVTLEDEGETRGEERRGEGDVRVTVGSSK